MTDHIRLHLDIDVLLSIVDSDDASNHLWHNHHVTKMCFNRFGFVTVCCFSLRFAQLLEECDRLALDTAAKLSSLSCTKELHQVLITVVQQFVQIDSTVRILAESAL